MAEMASLKAPLSLSLSARLLSTLCQLLSAPPVRCIEPRDLDVRMVLYFRVRYIEKKREEKKIYTRTTRIIPALGKKVPKFSPT